MSRLTTPRNCIRCGKEFFPDASHARRGKALHCSRACWYKGPHARSPRWKGGVVYNKQGYRLLWNPEHGRANGTGYVLEHIAVAEAALGKPLPLKAKVHHVDEVVTNNANSNLVICENQAYHRLLHSRLRVVKAGGNPDLQKFCTTCKTLLYHLAFRKDSSRGDGLATTCKACYRDYILAPAAEIQAVDWLKRQQK